MTKDKAKKPKAAKAAKKKAPKLDHPLGVGSRGKRKLTDEAVLQIVARYRAGGITQKALAEEYGVSAPNVSAIMRGKLYFWLTKIGAPVTEPLAVAA